MRMKGYVVVVNFLVLVCQCSTKHVSDEIFPGYSGDGSGEDTTTIVRQISTTTIKILNDDNDIDDVIATTITSQTDDDFYINQTTQVNKDQGINEKNNYPSGSDDISVNEEAIIGLVIVASLIFCCIAVLLVLIVLRKRKSSQKHNIPTVYPHSRNFFITSTKNCSKSTEVLDVSGSTFEYMRQ
ncbi:uncharacterized protein LOC110455154 [Mizuhopecten yessoensis]|uniref:Uncharacterized protein n=1 Tax=Mizuhopecten yessoensis TaxID=6573 RepID=A0A210QDI2_MIZYE|nr:uncharacterized protein LOC110455154 [Mizuhopecten yessoensis]OWF46807.1 hypothetical protein KP79_PYT22275 [Mizuhopecten yessoensis]